MKCKWNSVIATSIFSCFKIVIGLILISNYEMNSLNITIYLVALQVVQNLVYISNSILDDIVINVFDDTAS